MLRLNAHAQYECMDFRSETKSKKCASDKNSRTVTRPAGRPVTKIPVQLPTCGARSGSPQLIYGFSSNSSFENSESQDILPATTGTVETLRDEVGLACETKYNVGNRSGDGSSLTPTVPYFLFVTVPTDRPSTADYL